MALQIFANLDRNTLSSGLVVSATNLNQKAAPQLVAGDKISIDVFLTSSSGIQDIQTYSVQRLGIGSINATPTGGTYKIDYGGSSNETLQFNATAQDFADAIETNAPSVPSPATGTEIAPFTYIIDFGSFGTCDLPTIESSLTPLSTVSVQRLVTGDSSTKEQWLVRIYQNPIALVDTWTNVEPITDQKAIRGSLNLGTQGIFDLLDGNASAVATIELELTDSSGNLQTIFQAPTTIFSQVIGEAIAGVIPTPAGIPASATTFLNTFPNPTFAGDVTFNGSISGLNTSDISGLSAALALKANIADPTFTGNATAPKLTTSEIQAVAGEAIEYDSIEHRFRDEDEVPNNLVVIKKDDGVPIGKVGINHSNPKVALHVVGGHTSAGGIDDEALRVVGSGLFTSDNDTALVVAMDTDNTASTSDAILKLKRDERASETNNVEEMNFGFVGSDFIYTNSTANAAYLEIEKGRAFEIAVRNTSGVLVPFRMLKVDNVGVDVSGTMKVGHFTTTERNALSAENGMIIYNSSEDTFQGYADGGWTDLSG